MSTARSSGEQEAGSGPGPVGRVASISRFPVKSLHDEHLSATALTELGIRGDRGIGWSAKPSARTQLGPQRKDGQMSTWFEEYLAAWNSRDVERVLSWMTDDIVFEDTTLGHVATGTDQMRRFVESFAKIPEARFEFITGFDDGATFAMEWVMHPMKLRGATIGSLRGNGVCAHRDFYDGAQFQPDQN